MNSLQISTLNFSDTLWSLSIALKKFDSSPKSKDTLLQALHKVIYDSVALSCKYEDDNVTETFTPPIIYACEAYLDEFIEISNQEGNDRSLSKVRATKQLVSRMTRMVAAFQQLVDNICSQN